MKIIQGNSVAISKNPISCLPFTRPENELRKKAKDKMSIEALSDNTKIVGDGDLHSIVAAAQIAFADHKRMVLSPDMIWTHILQQVAMHVGQNSEELRKEFVKFEGKQIIEVRRDDFVKGGTNPWPEIFPAFTSKIREYIGEENSGILMTSFTTTTPTTKAAMEIAVMDVVQSYFDYLLMTKCGIPEFGLEGTKEDWEWINGNVKKLEKYGMKWWVEPLLEVTGNFVDAINDKPNSAFWQSFFKYQSMSGGDSITGHINKLFAYKSVNRKMTKATEWGRWNTSAYTGGISSVPFTWSYFDKEFDMRFYSGFIGVAYDAESVRPHMAWGVTENKAAKKSESFERVSKHLEEIRNG